MKLDKTLNFKKVRCVEGNYSHGLIRDKVYDVISTEYNEFFGKLFIKIDKNGIGTSYLSDFFEPVLDSAENPLENMKLTPEFETEASEPTFEVGDKVYIPGDPRVLPILFKNGEWFGVSYKEVNPKYILHATPENYEMLCKLYPHIEFEQPAKELTGSDLARDLIKKGWKGFTCVCGNSGDDNVMITTIVTGTNNSGQFVDFKGRLFNNAIPMLGSYPLTQAVLDE